MTPFYALYGYHPPHIDIPTTQAIPVAEVAQYMKHREMVVDLIKDSLQHAQERMKWFADKN
ncbi:hypothetical protein ACHQM5_009858 [Ranunculus cassubicifolius]